MVVNDSPPFNWYTSAFATTFLTYADARSHRIPPVQYIKIFFPASAVALSSTKLGKSENLRVLGRKAFGKRPRRHSKPSPWVRANLQPSTNSYRSDCDNQLVLCCCDFLSTVYEILVGLNVDLLQKIVLKTDQCLMAQFHRISWRLVCRTGFVHFQTKKTWTLFDH